MKSILKIITGIFFLPFLILGGLIAVVKVLFISTFGLAWQKGDDWYGVLLIRLDSFMQWVKK